MPTRLQTIDDVLRELDTIIDRSVKANDQLGVFAFVYWRTTEKIKEGIAVGRFSDPARLEAFDVAFARRYIDAYWQLQNGERTTRAWAVPFAARREGLTQLQHLLLGMNAHINLDLGIVAAEQAPGDQIHLIREDFMSVNQILAELTDELQERLSRVSPLLFLLDWVGGRKDEAVVNFSIRRARDFAWHVANRLAYLEGTERERFLRATDEDVAAIAHRVRRPPGRVLHTTLAIIRFFEEKQVKRIVERLREAIPSAAGPE